MEFVFLFSLTIICSGVGYSVGHTKDQATLGFFLGFLLGPIGILIILFTPSPTAVSFRLDRGAVKAKEKANKLLQEKFAERSERNNDELLDKKQSFARLNTNDRVMQPGNAKIWQRQEEQKTGGKVLFIVLGVAIAFLGVAFWVVSNRSAKTVSIKEVRAESLDVVPKVVADSVRSEAPFTPPKPKELLISPELREYLRTHPSDGAFDIVGALAKHSAKIHVPIDEFTKLERNEAIDPAIDEALRRDMALPQNAGKTPAEIVAARIKKHADADAAYDRALTERHKDPAYWEERRKQMQRSMGSKAESSRRSVDVSHE